MSQPPSHSHTQKFDLEDGVSFIDLVKILWGGKWVIFGITLLACSLAVIFLIRMPSKLTATTPISPIGTLYEFDYAASNAVGFFEVSSPELLTLYIETLDDGEALGDVVRKSSLISRDDFSSDMLFEEALSNFINSIRLLPPENTDRSRPGFTRPNWELVVTIGDGAKWLEVLGLADELVNQQVAQRLKERFEATVDIAVRERDFELDDLLTRVKNEEEDYDVWLHEFETRRAFNLEDIALKIKNEKENYDVEMEEFEARLGFDLEDISLQIDNALADYDTQIGNRVAFLREQAEIARALGVAKNTIEAQTFAAGSGIVASVEKETPFYLRGYEAIEKEIELIESRDEKQAFVPGLLELEQKRRKLLQDQTVERKEERKRFLERVRDLEENKRQLEQDTTLARADVEKQFLSQKLELQKQIRDLRQNQLIERATAQFQKTPAWSGRGFKAATLIPQLTEFEAQSSKVMILFIVGLISSLFSCAYVLVYSVLQSQREST